MIFELSNASFSFSGNGENGFVFDDVSFSCESGQIVGILGCNGVGKTTLLKCITNLLPLSKGVAKLNDEDVKRIPSRVLWQRVSYVPQIREFVSSCSVEEMILLGRTPLINCLSVPKDEDYKAVDEVIELLGLEKIRLRSCREISGGELQLALIARALVSNPEVLILDEPESNLDFYNQLLVLEKIVFLAKERGLVCIFNTHYPEHALRFANKSLILGKDCSWVFGKSQDVVSCENIEKYFNVKTFIGNVNYESRDYSYIVPIDKSF